MRAALKIGALFLLFAPCAFFAQEIVLKGHVTDPQGNAIPNASVQLLGHDRVISQTRSGGDGQFLLKVSSVGDFTIKIDAQGFRSVSRPVTVAAQWQF